MNEFTDWALLEEPPSLPSPAAVPPYPSQNEGEVFLFQFVDHEQYAWDDREFLKRNRGANAYRFVPLTRGYFAIVDAADYRRITTYPDGSPKRWYANVQRDSQGVVVKAYAARRGRGDEPRCVFMHRELLDCLHDGGDVDHINGLGLDNRRKKNLRFVKRLVNNLNTRRKRTTNAGLPVGVERRRNGRYGGIRAVRLGKHKVRTIRSKRSWLTPEPAARWYRNQLKKLCGNLAWAHQPHSVDYPVLPPRVESEPEHRVAKKKNRVCELPF